MAPVAPTAPSPRPAAAGSWGSVPDLLHQLGDVAPERVRMTPSPGTATLDDLIAANELKEGPICEWVDGTLVEKPMGFHESTVAMILGFEIELYLRSNDVGMIAGPDGGTVLPGLRLSLQAVFDRADRRA
jgi:hypothetical protein